MLVCFLKALLHFLDGNDLVVLVQDDEVKHLIDQRIGLAIAMRQHLGNLIVEPYKEHKLTGYGLYFMITPLTANNILRLRNN